MVFTESEIANVAGKNDIVGIIGAHVPLVADGAIYTGTCPFHGGPGFQVDGLKQVYRCYGCGSGGTVFRFEMDRQSIPFAEAFRQLSGEAA